jgi:hypothetical protein
METLKLLTDNKGQFQFANMFRDFSINGLAFHNLPKDKQDQILNYTLWFISVQEQTAKN